MQLTVLGSGTVAPTADRTAAAYWVETGCVRLLLDCGAGTLHRAALFDIPWSTATHVAISHFHLDHWGELPHYLFALRWGTVPPRSTPLVLIGPRGIRARLTLVAAAFEDWLCQPEYGLDIVELDPGDGCDLARDVHLESASTAHTEESLAYAITADGARLVYTGDTGFDESLAQWSVDCDLLLAECSLPEQYAIESHLTPQRAGRLARLARARRLVLTHFYPLFSDADPAAGARTEFAGQVSTARDGDRFMIPEV